MHYVIKQETVFFLIEQSGRGQTLWKFLKVHQHMSSKLKLFEGWTVKILNCMQFKATISLVVVVVDWKWWIVPYVIRNIHVFCYEQREQERKKDN